MGQNAGLYWGWAMGLLLVGLPFSFFAPSISRWNRRASSTWGWNVPDEGSSGAWRWSEKYMRWIGIVAAAAGLVMLMLAITRSA